ncbi:MAG: hypothetical protein HFE63_09250 [Clostridiales bacterium]|nr:hypothetical protein [Clostridiales bacterium]
MIYMLPQHHITAIAVRMSNSRPTDIRKAAVTAVQDVYLVGCLAIASTIIDVHLAEAVQNNVNKLLSPFS